MFLLGLGLLAGAWVGRTKLLVAVAGRGGRSAWDGTWAFAVRSRAGRSTRSRWVTRAGLAGVVAAVLVGGHMAWMVWGTNLGTARAQTVMRAEVVSQLPGVSGPTHETLLRIPTNVRAGQPLGLIRIPRIGLDMVFVEGTGTTELTRGPGHYSGTAFPWASTGRVAIAGHRTTYLHPFWALNELQVGDRIVLSTKVGVFRYEVTGRANVDPGDTKILRQTTAPTLVLTTCTPRFSATQRLAVFARRI